MSKIVLGMNHVQVLIGSLAETTNLALEIDDVIEMLFSSATLIIPKSFGLSATSRYRRAL